MHSSTNSLAQVGAQISSGVSGHVGDILIILGEIVCIVGLFWSFRLLCRYIDRL